MSQNYNLPAPLGLYDKYGKAILTLLMVLLFILSVIGYIFLNFFSKPPDVPETVASTKDYEVIAIHKASVRPGDEENTLTVKVVPNSNLATETIVSVKITELNPTLVILNDEREKSFTLPNDRAQMQAHFDVVNIPGLPNNINFKIEVKQDEQLIADKVIAIKLSKITSQQFALMTAVLTGLVSLWLFFGQEVLKKRVTANKEATA